MADTSLAVVRITSRKSAIGCAPRFASSVAGRSSTSTRTSPTPARSPPNAAKADALAGQLTETLAEIDDALAKLDAGTYGTCESCQQQIGEERLEAMPEARLCITCASQRR